MVCEDCDACFEQPAHILEQAAMAGVGVAMSSGGLLLLWGAAQAMIGGDFAISQITRAVAGCVAAAGGAPFFRAAKRSLVATRECSDKVGASSEHSHP
jgi:hypothetical protein